MGPENSFGEARQVERFQLPLEERAAQVAQSVGRPALIREMSRDRSDYDPRCIVLDFDLATTTVNQLLNERVPGTIIRPNLVLPQQIKNPEAYQRLSGQAEKQEYRDTLRAQLAEAWQTEYGIEKAGQILDNFNRLSSTIEEDGALVVGDLVNRDAFGGLVQEYDHLMQESGSTSLLHSYVNLRNQPGFLTNHGFNGAFFHPLAIALISERVGGAIRVVDARAKDAGPISVQAQDNMLHIDNTPYRDEYKVLVTWEKGRASGPKGQNFVFLPGTHKGIRQSLMGLEGPYSTERDSVFSTAESIVQAFEIQRQTRGGEKAVVEMQDSERPLTTIFPSGSLVHHRLRTEEGHSRSGLIIAFHRAADSPGKFISDYQAGNDATLEEALFRFQDANSDTDFRRILKGYAREIAEKIDEIFDAKGQSTIIDAKERTLSAQAMEVWHKIATGAPTVEQIKQRNAYFPLGAEINFDDFMTLLSDKMMHHDKHAPYYMILYADGREETRKWARNRIREMSGEVLKNRLNEWQDEIKQPMIDDLLSLDDLLEITNLLAKNAAAVSPKGRSQGRLDAIERISPTEAYRAVEQLIIDLGENLSRADSRQTYLTLSLFQFWACDELNRLQGNNIPELKQLGGRLLRNYIAAAIVIEKQITEEVKL